MALIVEQHVVADQYSVGTTAITAGMLVSLSGGLVVPTPKADTAAKTVLGIAGDSALDGGAKTTAYSDEVKIGASATSKYTSNRVSDFYDESAASGKITVYNGGGKFWISKDLFDVSTDISAGELLRPSAATDGLWDDGATVADNDEVALAVGASQPYASGVPGTDVSGSISLGDFVPVILRV